MPPSLQPPRRKRQRDLPQADGPAPVKVAKYQSFTFADRRSIIAEARVRFQPTVDGTGRWLSLPPESPEGPVFFHATKSMLYLKHVVAWARAELDQDWSGFEKDPRAVKQFGASCLDKRARLPAWWLNHIAQRANVGDEGAASCDAPEATQGLRQDSGVTGAVSTEVASFCSQQVSQGSKKCLLQRYPRLVQVIEEWKQSHDVQREEDEDVSFNDLRHTFNCVLARHREVAEQSGLAGSLPTGVSIGWFSGMKKACGISDDAVASTESKRVSVEQEEEFHVSCNRKRQANNIPLAGIIVFDETNAFLCQKPTRVQVSARERRMRPRTSARPLPQEQNHRSQAWVP
eukprot:2723584-Karenia_brevis.AAC.1